MKPEVLVAICFGAINLIGTGVGIFIALKIQLAVAKVKEEIGQTLDRKLEKYYESKVIDEKFNVVEAEFSLRHAKA